jgi:3-hydroxyethyl bacteriochlorophyllide a dehydrogenase
MDSLAIVITEPRRIDLCALALTPAGESDVVVETEWSGISTGTEKLLWSGAMPPFPGMGYPLVPGYEAVGRIIDAGLAAKQRIGERVFVPGAQCFGPVRGLFGASASRLVVPEARVAAISDKIGEQGVLLALAATAYHASAGYTQAELIIGHGVLGRLLARIAVAKGARPPVVWENNAARRAGASGYTVVDSEADPRRDYRVIFDASGDAAILDTLIARLAPGGEIVLAGFYAKPLSFTFPPAFMREARFRIAAQFLPSDLAAVTALVEAGALSLDGLITHHAPASDASGAYRTAFETASCLKMVIDWRNAS